MDRLRSRKKCLFWCVMIVTVLGTISLNRHFNAYVLKSSRMISLGESVYSPAEQMRHPEVISTVGALRYAEASDVAEVAGEGARCDAIIRGDEGAIKEAEQNKNFIQILDANFTTLAADCDRFRRERQYLMWPVSQEERDYPIAYSIMLFKEVQMFERLLRAIYRPQNYYCIHVDLKANSDVLAAVSSITRCFPNVFLASRFISVDWGTFSVLEADLICMADLLRYKSWKYFINLTGQEFPLKTNLDLVQILKAFNGSNNIHGSVKNLQKERTDFIFKGLINTYHPHAPPPVNVTLTKGSVHITATRAYVEYVIHDPRAASFLEWLNDTFIPDETFFTSLGHSPQLEVPGAYKGVPEAGTKYPHLTRYKNWGKDPCRGKVIREICIFALGDLERLTSRPEMFVNKFNGDFQPHAIRCLDQWLQNRTRNEILGTEVFDVSGYSKYEFVWNHVPSDSST